MPNHQSIQEKLQEAEAALRESEARLRSLLQNEANAIIFLSSDHRILEWNTGAELIYGYQRDEVLGKNFVDFLHPEDIRSALGADLDEILGGEPTRGFEYTVVGRDGGERVLIWNATRLLDLEGQPVGIVAIGQDITERKRAEERLLHSAFHDPLTDLPNRALFMEHLEHAVERAKRREDLTFAVLFLDLDRLKIINDSLGHRIGDQLLIAVAKRLADCVRPGDTVSRFGGDEFAILLHDCREVDDVLRVADRIQTELSAPFDLSGNNVRATTSIGIALSATGYDNSEDLLGDADSALYRAKQQGRARYEVFDTDMLARAVARRQLETELRGAVEQRGFRIHYQPVISLETGRIVSFEALGRWQHPKRGLISPADFIPVAEETGLIIEIGWELFRQACQQTRLWQEKFPVNPPLGISVNLSGRQFTQQNLAGQIDRLLRENGLAASSLSLEITEDVLMEDPEARALVLSDLRALGIRVYIDDFGTGHSSLDFMYQFPIDGLKIAHSFISRIGAHGENTEIVRMIVMLARDFGVDAVAEGVETKDQLAQLRALNCKKGQGFYFSRPLDGAAAENLLAADPQW